MPTAPAAPQPPAWFWAAAFVLGFGLRFYRLSDLSVWPLVDESVHAWIAQDWTRGWDGLWFHYVSQMPPLYFLLLSWVFRGDGVGFRSLCVLPAVVSFLTALLAWVWTRRRDLPPAASWAALLLMASFWPAYLGRFSHPAVLVPFWELGIVILLFEWKARKESTAWLAALGLWTGAGFYTYLAWPVAALAGASGVWILGDRKGRVRDLTLFSVAAILAASPLVVVAVQRGFGGYYRHLWSAGTPGWTPLVWVGTLWDYLRSMWFGVGSMNFFYTPAWGGLWSPFLGLGVLAGLWESYRHRSSPWARWAMVCAGLFLLPGMLSVSLNPLRIVAWVPLGVVFGAWGWIHWTDRLPRRMRTWALTGLVLLSFGWDAYHLVVRYPGLWSEGSGSWGQMSKSWKFKQAGDLLVEEAKKNGPGRYLAGFQLDPVDQSLDLDREKWESPMGESHWVALVADQNYRPFLGARFKALRIYDLPRGGDWDGGSCLYVIPLDPNEGKWVEDWSRTDLGWRSVVTEGFKRSEGEGYDAVLRRLAEVTPRGSDPFLADLEGEKTALFHELDSAYGSRNKTDNFHWGHDALVAALRSGYPAAHLWNELGSMRELAGDRKGAIECYRNATRAPFDATPAKENLKRLLGM